MDAPSSRFRRLAQRIALALLAPLLVLALAESACRILGLGLPTRFLIPSTVNNQRVWIDNQVFGYRYFIPPVSRAPTPIVIPREKAPGELRIVLLGESAAMGEPEPAFGPARQLELMLEEQYPDRPIRVINAAMTAINSHVILEIARDLKRMQPDFVILYIGNNEVVGPYGAGTVFASFSPSYSLNRLRSVLTRLRLSSAIRSAWYRSRVPDREQWKGMEMFTGIELEAGSPHLEHVYDAYRKNMLSIIRSVHDAGAVPVLSTIAVNLRDLAPLDGTHGDLFDGTHAATLDELKQARDADRMRFRADSRINGIIREIANHDTRVLLTDAEAAFEADHIPGHNAFLDHVHFNLTGSFMLADLLRQTLGATAQPAPTFSEITKRAGWNPYTALEIAERIRERIARPPFTRTANFKSLMHQWTTEIVSRTRQINALGPEDTIENLNTLAERYPDEPAYPYLTLGVHLYDNRFHDAVQSIARLHRVVPHRADIRGWSAILAAVNGQAAQAWTIMTRNAPPLGEMPIDTLISSSETLSQSGYRAESAELLQQAVDHAPHRLRAQGLLATRLAQAGKRDEATARFKELIADHPDTEWIKEEYGLLMAISGRPAEANELLAHLRESDDPDQRLKYAQFMIYAGSPQASAEFLEATVAANPGHAPSWRMLLQLYMQTGRTAQSLAAADRVIELEPWQGGDHVIRGTILDVMNRPADALRAYEAALPLLGSPMEVLRSMAWIHATEPEPPIRNGRKALLYIERAMELEPAATADPYTLHVYGAALAAAGRFDEARATAAQALAAVGETNDALRNELRRADALYAQARGIVVSRD